MRVEKIALDQTGYFSESFLEYVASSEKLTPFYTATPTIDHFEQVINARNFPNERRETLVRVLKEQYQNITQSNAVQGNIDSLASANTFTITTGHQLNIFTGPLYFIYKIVTVINSCKELKKKYPNSQFVPVYWMASEDHDFEEISYFFLQGGKYSWSTKQGGAVGRFDPKELEELINELPGDVSIFEKAYLNNETLASAVRQYVNELFGEEGLVVIDADSASLKKEFTPIIAADIFNRTPKKLVDRQSEKLSSLGFKIQVHCREINFFYLEDGIRERIEWDGERFNVVNTDLVFSESELQELIDNCPERFSPNVILRPLYQEIILPNLAYVGGPSELVYWLQLKLMFEEFNVPFPILMPRNFGTFIPKSHFRTWSKTGLEISDLFSETHLVEKKWLEMNGAKSLTFDSEKVSLETTFDNLKSKVEAVDTTLIQHLDALKTQALKRMNLAEKKLVRAEKRNHEDAMGQIHRVKDFLFPNGSLQERRDNFMNFYQENPKFIQQLMDAFDSFDYRMHVLIDDD